MCVLHFARCLFLKMLDDLSGYYCWCLRMRTSWGGFVGEHVGGRFLVSANRFHYNMTERLLGKGLHSFLFLLVTRGHWELLQRTWYSNCQIGWHKGIADIQIKRSLKTENAFSTFYLKPECLASRAMTWFLCLLLWPLTVCEVNNQKEPPQTILYNSFLAYFSKENQTLVLT